MCPSDTVVALQMWPLTSHNATQINHQAVNITAGWEESENEVGIFPNEDRGKFYWCREHEEKWGKKPGVQKFPNLEVGFSKEYLCVLKKVSLSHGKKLTFWVFKFFHIQLSLSPLYTFLIATPSSFCGARPRALSLFYFKMNSVKMFPRSVLFCGQREREMAIYLL